MNSWPIEIEGNEFYPIPESWIVYGDDNNTGHPRVYAVSVGQSVRNQITVRYVHPRQQRVYTATMGSTVQDDGVVPSLLANPHGSWPRSLVLQGDVESVGVARSPEVEHLRELWRERVETVATTGGQVDV